MIKSVVRQYRFQPDVIDKLYIDNIDHHGLVYWYEDCKQIDDEIKKTTPKTPN